MLFNQIFEVLYKLSIDSDPNVQSATYLLDRFVKVDNFHILDIHVKFSFVFLFFSVFKDPKVIFIKFEKV